MKKYYVTVNGNRYQVEVEEVKGDFDINPSYEPKVEVQEPKPEMESIKKHSDKATEQKPVQKLVQNNIPEDGENIIAPMPGTIVSVNIKEGQKISVGDLLFVLEAMKMENEIVSPVEGTVATVVVSKGQSVNTEDLLAIIQ